MDSDEDLENLGYSGIPLYKQVGENVVFKDVLCLKDDGKFWIADSDEEITSSGMCVMALETILADAYGLVLREGFVRDDSDNWTVAGKLYIHTTGGPPTQTKPSGVGDQIRIIGYATHADRFFFHPDSSYVEVE